MKVELVPLYKALLGENFVLENGRGLLWIYSIDQQFCECSYPLLGKVGVDSYSKGSWSQHDFEAIGHEEIALDKTFTVAPPLPNLNTTGGTSRHIR